MPLLFSNFPPLRTDHATYTDTFKGLLNDSDSIHLATGYISSDSAIDLKGIIEANGGPRLELCVGMHYFEGLSPVQLEALRNLDVSLRGNNLGKVHLVTTFPFHGKLVSFSRQDSIIGSIIGSSNLSNILEGRRQYEADYLIEDSKKDKELKSFIDNLIDRCSRPLELLDVKPNMPENDLLKDQLGVVRLQATDLDQIKRKLSKLSFEIPLKGDQAQRSGLNASFGEGRRNVQGLILPRPWYEVELIVPKNITTQPGYPKADSRSENGSFAVVTDDGWQFRCKVSGDFSKNLRSEDDLKILGKWLKGRLENTSVLKPGNRVDDSTFVKYGRNNITLTKLTDSNTWYMDFGVNEYA
jgi:hypothetical protein